MLALHTNISFVRLRTLSSIIQPKVRLAFISIRQYRSHSPFSYKTDRESSDSADNMKVLVTGGSGFIAAHCVDQLLSHGFVYWPECQPA